MSFNKLVYERVKELYENSELWIDPYDSESFKNKYLRKIVKGTLYFSPHILYKLKIVRTYVWAENMELIGKIFLMLGDIKNATKVYHDLLALSDGNLYWGLPIEWKTKKNIFPAGTMMSTTTSEIALFFTELSKQIDVISHEVLSRIGYNLLNGLKKVYEDKDKLILGYTPYDNYEVNNSNLLVAAALYEIGRSVNDENLIKNSIKITNAAIDGISENGGIPYYMHGNYYDSYHQMFSLRALHYLKKSNHKLENVFHKGMKFFIDELMDKEGNVYLTPDKNIIDMQGSAEALGFFKKMNNTEVVEKISKMMNKNLKKNGGYIQRNWIIMKHINIKSNTLFTRQGELRLLLSLIDSK